jgi:MFS family permease
VDTRSKRNLQLSYFDAFFSSLMIGAGEAFFAAYALSKGLGEVVAGLVIGLPMMMGAVVQTATPPLFGRFARTKTWVLIMSSMQALCLIALTFSSAIPQAGSFVIFVLIGLYWAFAFSAGTVWNYWMGYLVPEQECSSFFSFRLRLSQVGVVIGLLIAGFFLHHGEVSGWGAKAYFLPFFVAFISRCLSVYFLGGQSGVPIEKTVHKFSLNVRDFFSATARVFRDNPQARADLTFLFLFTVTLYISSNFVTPFLLVKRQFNYLLINA